MKKRLLKQAFFILLYCLFIGKSYSQDVSMHTQGILQQEFLNPAYNAFKNYVSIAAYNRTQWESKFDYSPKTYATNLYLPIANSSLGVNIGGIYEDIGLRTTTEIKAGLCHKVRFSLNSYLALGFSAGFFQRSFDTQKIDSYKDEDWSLLYDSEELNSIYPAISAGVLLLLKHSYFSFSSMTTCIKSNSNNSYFPGFDFSCGTICRLSSWIYLRPAFVIKYYNEKGIKSENGEITDQYNIPVIYDLSLNFLIRKRIWVGTSYRLNQAQTFSVDLKASPHLKLGYTYELGIGDGLNQFNSYGVRLSYIIQKKGKKKTYNSWTGEYMRGNVASFIY